MSREASQAAQGRRSLSVPRHTYAPHPTLPSLPRSETRSHRLAGTWDRRAPNRPSCPVARQDGRRWEGLVGAMLAAGEQPQAGSAQVWMELTGQSHLPRGYASIPALPAAFCSVSRSTRKGSRSSFAGFVCVWQVPVSRLVCVGLPGDCHGLPGVGKPPQLQLGSELLAQQEVKAPKPPPGFPVPRLLLHSKVPCIKTALQSGKPLSCTVSFLFSSS